MTVIMILMMTLMLENNNKGRKKKKKLTFIEAYIMIQGFSLILSAGVKFFKLKVSALLSV